MFETKSPRRGGKWPLITAWLSITVLVVAAAFMAGAGLAYKAGWVELGASFNWLSQGAQLSVVAAGLGLLTLLLGGIFRRWRLTMVGLGVCVAVFAMLIGPMQLKQRAESVPPIHDITTDMESPPAFRALVPAREEAPNEVDYPGEGTATQQQAGYPELKPINLNMSLAEAMDRAEATVQARGWNIAEITGNRIEATATTRWFGFKDDVIIRMTETTSGVQVDMRSASRVGKSDVGTNAARIQAFLEDLKNR